MYLHYFCGSRNFCATAINSAFRYHGLENLLIKLYFYDLTNVRLRNSVKMNYCGLYLFAFVPPPGISIEGQFKRPSTVKKALTNLCDLYAKSCKKLGKLRQLQDVLKSYTSLRTAKWNHKKHTEPDGFELPTVPKILGCIDTNEACNYVKSILSCLEDRFGILGDADDVQFEKDFAEFREKYCDAAVNLWYNSKSRPLNQHKRKPYKKQQPVSAKVAKLDYNLPSIFNMSSNDSLPSNEDWNIFLTSSW